ncbi:Glycosyl transferase [Rosistilla carotiformis]|uniref:Lipid-A-disaccharide synthase n=1 Tax=Rosistilla carotiformis TaxID=2528017 RepID=A0A518JMP4_9BACT|nr:lipid-A-disaccharide synthase [Rosistilla carotiformis]QDV66813.1 Glycosyl transferase [Rosistilla carotiformis]
MNQSIFFSAGEPSGDQHTARLIDALRVRAPQLSYRGFGGSEMQQAGCQLDFELTQLAVMGVVEVAPKVAEFYRVAQQATQIFSQSPPRAVVLVDFPGFNWHIAKRAKANGIPVYYYLPPQLWAWAPWRIRKVRKYVDKVLCVLPFEYQWYRERGIDAEYVGHPFFDAVAKKPLDPATMERFRTLRREGKRLVAVLPGSRRNEVTNNWPLQLEAIRRLSKRHPDVRFQVACFRDRQCLWCREQLTAEDQSLPLDFFVGKTSEIVEAAESAIMVSGSVSLELMARSTPAVVLYRVGRTIKWLASVLVSTKSMTLPNLMAEKTLFPEFVSAGDPEPVIAEVVAAADRLLSDPAHLADVQRELQTLRSKYAVPGASDRAADQLIAMFDANQAIANRRAA